MKDTALIEEWVTHCRAGGTPSTTLRVRKHYLERYAAACPALLCATTSSIAAWMSANEWQPNTRKTVRSALRAFYGWVAEVGYMETSPAEGLPVVRVPRGQAKPTPEGAYRDALCEPDERVALMVRLAGQGGLRRAEIAQVRREDLERDLLGWSLRVRGKGGHERLIPLMPDLARVIQSMPAGWLFPSPQGGHLTPGHVGKLLSRVLPVGYSGHSLRHRCGTAAYASTRDLLAVQQLLGHARPETTRGYIQLPNDAIRAAAFAAAA